MVLLSLSLSYTRTHARTHASGDKHARAWLSSRRCCHRGVSRLHAGRGVIGVLPYKHPGTKGCHRGTYTLMSHVHRLSAGYIHADVTCTQGYQKGTYTLTSHAHRIITGVHTRGCHMHTGLSPGYIHAGVTRTPVFSLWGTYTGVSHAYWGVAG